MPVTGTPKWVAGKTRDGAEQKGYTTSAVVTWHSSGPIVVKPSPIPAQATAGERPRRRRQV